MKFLVVVTPLSIYHLISIGQLCDQGFATIKASNKFYKTTLPDDMIFTKEDFSTSEEIPCELLGICTLVHVNEKISVEGSFHFCGSG